MALDEFGNVWTWGSNHYAYYSDAETGQLGDNTYDDRPTPVKVVAPDRNNDGNPDDLNGNDLEDDPIRDGLQLKDATQAPLLRPEDQKLLP